MSEAGPTSDSVYTRLGGEPAVRALVDRFYQLMDQLPEAQGLRRLHPDLPRAADSLFKYLSGWFGGPPLYTRERGHPRLRMCMRPTPSAPWSATNGCCACVRPWPSR